MKKQDLVALFDAEGRTTDTWMPHPIELVCPQPTKDVPIDLEAGDSRPTPLTRGDRTAPMQLATQDVGKDM
jgi:hypothetical protein